MGLMYQPAVLKKYNLSVPTTWSQFASDAAALHKADPSMYLDPFVLNDPSILESLWWQAGARPFVLEPNGTWRFTINGPVEQQVTNFWANLVKSGNAPVDNDFTTEWTHHIAQDRYAAAIGAAWGPAYVISSNLASNSTQEWAVTQLPQWTAGAHATANWGGSTNAVTKDCPSADVKDAALFAAYINTSKSGIAIDEESGPKVAAGSSGGDRPVQRPAVQCPGAALHGQYQRRVQHLRRAGSDQLGVEPLRRRVPQLHEHTTCERHSRQADLGPGPGHGRVPAGQLRQVGRLLGRELNRSGGGRASGPPSPPSGDLR